VAPLGGASVAVRWAVSAGPEFDARFAAGPPSLVQAQRLTVRGDVAFGADVVVRGEVTVEQRGDEQRRIDDGTVLEG